MKLVDDWKDAPRWLSVRIMAVLAVLPLVWSQLPDDVKAFLPEEYQPFLLTLLAFGGIVGRLKDQK